MYDKRDLACQVLIELQSTDERFGAVSHDDAFSFVVYSEAEIALYLNTKLPLSDEFVPKIKELAKLKLTGEHLMSNHLKSRSYQEGEISESETYLTSADIEEREKALLSSLGVHRRCRIVT